ncbi:MAG: hypothetical protein KatS3mg068_2240 [Candidatus Sericytochromatia bacterium]|nr:MAG: hypothetical protein KatS3mg068_2240 [Candidatus Sericytochromatia bacterium]
MESNNKVIYGSTGDFLKFLKDRAKEKKKNVNNKKDFVNKKNNDYLKNKFTS